MDDELLATSLAKAYNFQEVGYNANVECIYDASSEYMTMPGTGDMLYKAIGWRPNSPGYKPEFSV